MKRRLRCRTAILNAVKKLNAAFVWLILWLRCLDFSILHQQPLHKKLIFPLQIRSCVNRPIRIYWRKLTALLQRNPGPAVSHWILQIFIEQLLHGIPIYRCFFLYKFLMTLFKHLIYFTSVVPFCTPSKYQENQKCSVFRGCRNGILIWNGLRKRDFIWSTDSCLWTRNLEGFFCENVMING